MPTKEVKMGNVVDFTKYKQKRPVFNEWAIDWGIEDCTAYHPPVKRWGDYSHEEKIVAHINQKSLITNYYEHVSKTRFPQQFDRAITILPYPKWFRKVIEDGLFSIK